MRTFAFASLLVSPSAAADSCAPQHCHPDHALLCYCHLKSAAWYCAVVNSTWLFSEWYRIQMIQRGTRQWMVQGTHGTWLRRLGTHSWWWTRPGTHSRWWTRHVCPLLHSNSSPLHSMVHGTMWMIQWTRHCMHGTLAHSRHCTVYNVQCTMYTECDVSVSKLFNFFSGFGFGIKFFLVSKKVSDTVSFRFWVF